MKRTTLTLLATLCCLASLAALTIYTIPRGIQSADWSMMTEFEQESAENDWTVYVVRDGHKVLLEGDNGRYSGCEPGETFYYSRTWDAEISQPVLRIHAVMPAIAVWIDDTLVYTDVPLTGDAAEQVVLPILATDRNNAVEILLHGEVYGHKLTIAQASPRESETGYAYVYPCDVEAVSTYGYERGIIAQANGTGFIELTLSLIVAVLCYLAYRQKDGSILLLALLAFLRLLGVITGADFFYPFTTFKDVDWEVCANRFTFSVVLGFLAFKCGRLRFLMGAMAIIHAICTLTALIVQIIGLTNNTFVFINFLPDRLTLAFLAIAVIVSIIKARQGIVFFTMFWKQMLICFTVAAVIGAAYLSTHGSTWDRLLAGQVDLAIFMRGAIVWILQAAVIGTTMFFAVKALRSAREERVFAIVRAQAVEQSYESLQQYQKDVMSLRHDIKRHDLALKGFLDEGNIERAKEYLASLLEQQEQIPQVIYTDNALINIILGSRVAMAEGSGICVEILRMNAPEKLPISDQETVSLILNIVDNAIEAARRVKSQPAVIRLDMHRKNDILIFTCANAYDHGNTHEKSGGLNMHGYGHRIIERILEPHGSLITTHAKNGFYSITVALPLNTVQTQHTATSDNEPILL